MGANDLSTQKINYELLCFQVVHYRWEMFPCYLFPGATSFELPTDREHP